MFKRKKIFLSYSDSRRREADIIDAFFMQNGITLIRDKREENSFQGFMDKISKCDYVIFLLNNAFFDSIYCNYEMAIWEKYRVLAIPIFLCRLNVDNSSSRNQIFEKLQRQKNKLSPDQQDNVEKMLSSYDEYNRVVNCLLNIKAFHWYDDVNFESICNDIYIKIFNRIPKNTKINDIYKMLEMRLHDLDNISNDSLKRDFLVFLSDLKRCSSFRMSIFDEDDEWEERYILKEYHIDEGQIGASCRLEVVDEKGLYKKIDIYDICGIERNTSDFSQNHIKYYFVIINRHLYRDYMYQMRLPESCRQKEEERKYIRYGKSKQRCTLYFEDKNSMETNLCEHAIIVNDVR